jgi:dihydropteroate synthase
MSNKINENKPIVYQIKGKSLSFDKAMVMAIVNITPDSFYDGGKYGNINDVLRDAEEKVKQGASILDLGAASSRPNSTGVSEKEEWERLELPLTEIRKAFPGIFISVDTYYSEIVKKADMAGADIINDISGGDLDKDMYGTISGLDVAYIMMHMQGTPQTMQLNPQYGDVVYEVKNDLEKKIEKLNALGFKKIITDVGFGFGKNNEHNYQLLKQLAQFTDLGYPVLAGVSRKSMINKVIGSNPVTALNGTTVLNTIALMNGAKILRVHDVVEAKQAIDLAEYYSKH